MTMRLLRYPLFFAVAAAIANIEMCHAQTDDLVASFQDPPSEARPRTW